MSPQTARQAASQIYHEVWKDGIATGRKFTSLASAQRYSSAIGGEIRKA